MHWLFITGMAERAVGTLPEIRHRLATALENH